VIQAWDCTSPLAFGCVAFAHGEIFAMQVLEIAEVTTKVGKNMLLDINKEELQERSTEYLHFPHDPGSEYQ